MREISEMREGLGAGCGSIGELLEDFRNAPAIGKERKIMSHWEWKFAKWNEEDGKFEEFWVRREARLIEMRVEECGGGGGGEGVLKFVGGPTGFESYGIEGLLRGMEGKGLGGKFFICAGTVNRWPSCWVGLEEVKDFLREGEGGWP